MEEQVILQKLQQVLGVQVMMPHLKCFVHLIQFNVPYTLNVVLTCNNSNSRYLRGDCEKVIANECEPDPWDDWWTKMCLKGRAAGITDIMDGVDMQCIGNPKQCLQMGKAVASMVAYEFCPHWKSDGRSPQPPDLQEQCRQVAVDTCEGDIPSKVNYYCGIELTTQELWRLQRKCVKEVNLLVGHEPNLRH